MNLSNLTVIEQYLSPEELAFWGKMLSNESMWDQPHPLGESALLGTGTTANSIAYSPPYYEEYQKLLHRLCDTLEKIHEEPLCVASSLSFRRYTEGEGIKLHYDYSSDGDGRVLQLHEANRRPGEQAPYPAGIHDIQTVLYFNDNFEGGEVMFGDAESVVEETAPSVKPKAGMLISWPSTRMYGHGVRPVQSGVRYVMTGFWVRAKTLALATHTSLLPENWREIFLWPEKVDEMLGVNQE